ncbi:proton-coupled folate transporter [Penaeus vannamei]|uniref:proton-coupled folate transporter n=1 Tax=Penaeus vannamei TaxID=6689 RepID=UPI00387F71D6
MASWAGERQPLLPKEVSEKPISSTTCCGRARRFFGAVTVEPVCFLYAITFGMTMALLPNLWVDKICLVQLDYGEETCASLQEGKEPAKQDAVQKMSAQMSLYFQILLFVPAIFANLLLGAWGDMRGRRAPVLAPVVGSLFMALVLMANCYWWSLPPALLLLAALPAGCTGSMMAVFSGCHAYVGAVAGRRARTLRLSVLGVAMMVCNPVGRAVALLIYDGYGYVAALGCQVGMYVVSIVYILLRLKKWPSGARAPGERESRSVCSVLSPSSLKETLRTACKKREGGVHWDVLGHIVVICLSISTLAANVLFGYLYTRKKFAWDYNTYTVWSVIDLPLSSLGVLICQPILNYYWRVEDSILALAGGISHLFYYTLVATAPRPWVLYLASAVSLLSGLQMTSSRGALSKLVGREEQGSIFAVTGAAEALLPVVASLCLTPLYDATLDVFPGAVYGVCAALSLCVCVVLVMLLTRRPSEGLQSKEEK